jgi:hypothetical protein
MKQARVFITMNGRFVKTFPKDSFSKHEAALKREGWRIATTAEIKAAGFELKEVKTEKTANKKAEPKIEDLSKEDSY